MSVEHAAWAILDPQGEPQYFGRSAREAWEVFADTTAIGTQWIESKEQQGYKAVEVRYRIVEPKSCS